MMSSSSNDKKVKKVNLLDHFSITPALTIEEKRKMSAPVKSFVNKNKTKGNNYSKQRPRLSQNVNSTQKAASSLMLNQQPSQISGTINAINDVSFGAVSGYSDQEELFKNEPIPLTPLPDEQSSVTYSVNKLPTLGINSDFKSVVQYCKSLTEALGKQIEENNLLRNCIVANSDNINKIFVKTNNLGTVVNDHDRGLSRANNKIDNMAESNMALETRVEKLETIEEAKSMSEKLNIILLSTEEAKDLEATNAPLRTKVLGILRFMDVKYNVNTIHKVYLRNAWRFIRNNKVLVKMIVVEFINEKFAGGVFGQIVRYNSKASGEGGSIRYFAELPTGKRIRNLKLLCLDLKNAGHIETVKVTEKSVVVSYLNPNNPVNDPGAASTPRAVVNNEKDKGTTSSKNYKQFTVLCENDVDILRRVLKVPDCDIPIRDVKINYFYDKHKNENKKRQRDLTDLSLDDEKISPKKQNNNNNTVIPAKLSTQSNHA